MHKPKLHKHLFTTLTVLPTDYSDYGGEVIQWEKGDKAYPDCSGGCRWFIPLEGVLGMDWGVCAKQGSPRAGLLTFEHQAGYNCYEVYKEADPFSEETRNEDDE